MRFSSSWRFRPRLRAYSVAGPAAFLALGLNTRNLKHAESQSRTSSDDNEPLSSRDEDIPLFEDEESAAWAAFSSRFATARSSLSSIHWPTVGNAIAEAIVPDWAAQLPEYVAKLHDEIDMRPGSLADEIWQEAQDPYIHPEIRANTEVRVSKDLCAEELAFVQRRKKWTIRALAKYLEIPEADIDPQDVPTIAICGSGGGLRALVSGTASYLSAQEAGLFDCATYTSGVSGSCWLQTLYNSTLGGQRHDRIIEHLKTRIGTHIAYPPAFLNLMTKAPTNKFLLSGTLERLRGDPKADFGIVDVYGLLLATRLLIPKDELSVDESDMRLSEQRKYLKDGANPLPIYSAVRHEIPIQEHVDEDASKMTKVTKSIKEKAEREAWFQWFEFTPYEFFCEDINAGIPTWSIGRYFENGKTKTRDKGVDIPELRIPFLMGIWGSAFCATLAHYYKEIRPVVKGLAGFAGIDDLLQENNDDLVRLHPIDPGAMPNFAKGMDGQLPRSCPRTLLESEKLELMDAGMSNNLPLYPLLRQGRDIDIIVCFDASADIKQENWLSVTEKYAKERGLKGWPTGAGWPTTETAKDENEQLDAADAASAQQAASKVAEAREARRNNKPDADKAESDAQDGEYGTPLGYCNVWVGSTVHSVNDSTGEDPHVRNRVDPDAYSKLEEPNAGIAIVYFPMLTNRKVPGVDPQVSPFLSTWNLIYTPEQIDSVVALARANFEVGKDHTKETVRAVYKRKKAARLEMEQRARRKRWRNQLTEHGDHFQ
ncbi:MAG: hypothetical protein OHK93_000441 [Ramalina farinacea]|uniref:Lysophospholipase n=1 Tax=Ramalina farinacea TaxID=258253 RepID=A0AA43QGM6_9LECA|nr:hypothetical protein [Ramalina farinacea]